MILVKSTTTLTCSIQVYTLHTFVYFVDEFKWNICECGSDDQKPPSRFGHSATLLEPNYIVIFGGKDGLGHYFSDLYLFNIDSSEWTKVDISSPDIHPRAYHSLIKVNENLILFGGRDDHTLFNDVQALNIESNMWIHVIVNNTDIDDIPSGRFRHFAAAIDQSIICFGGMDEESPIFDIYFLDIEHIEESFNAPPTYAIDSPSKRTSSPYKRPVVPIEEEKQSLRDEKYVDQTLEEIQIEQQRITDNGDDSDLSIHSDEGEQSHPQQSLDNSFEFQVSFKEHVFLDEAQKSTPSPRKPSKPTTKTPTPLKQEKIIEEPPLQDIKEESDNTTVMQKVFDYLATEDGTVTLHGLLRLCRNCKILKNWITLENILEFVGQVLHLKGMS
jgi:hypothetical protein